KKEVAMSHYLISRTDHLGDILLTLPVAGILKAHQPDCRIGFLIPRYAFELVQCCRFVDTIHILEELDGLAPGERNQLLKSYSACIHVSPNRKIARWAWLAGIGTRIGTSRRWFHFLYCNSRVPLQRKNSKSHEAVLNLQLLKPLLAVPQIHPKDLIPFFGLDRIASLPASVNELLDPHKFKLIIHTRSMGNTRHWSQKQFQELMAKLPQHRFQIILTGTKKEREFLLPWLSQLQTRVTDLTGSLSLAELISLIQASDGMLSNSTGPMHIAAACGKHVIGLFANYTPIHPDRWAPIGGKAEVILAEKACDGCPSDESCACMAGIQPDLVLHRILNWLDR
ncbi:MAG TPA: glycosyltransferase family 9 protein, partial [Saprospiraceae bacterium]|nr:glycosyltransferase family 9 protein [Saprospiraceae bacterium]